MEPQRCPLSWSSAQHRSHSEEQQLIQHPALLLLQPHSWRDPPQNSLQRFNLHPFADTRTSLLLPPPLRPADLGWVTRPGRWLMFAVPVAGRRRLFAKSSSPAGGNVVPEAQGSSWNGVP